MCGKSNSAKPQRALALDHVLSNFVLRATRRDNETSEECLRRWLDELKSDHMLRAQQRRRVHERTGDMRVLLTVKEAEYYTRYRRQTLLRKEKAGEFPPRVHRGENSVAYLTRDVLAWMIAKAQTRRGVLLSPWLLDEKVDPVARLEGMRFVRWKEVAAIVGFSEQHARRLQRKGWLPRHFQMGANSVGFVRYELEASRLALLAAHPGGDN